MPEDLSVVGYDDSWFARLNRLSLTTVNGHITEVGQVAGRTLTARIDGERGSAGTRLLFPALVAAVLDRSRTRRLTSGRAASRTSSMRTGRCSASDSVAASATQPVSSASSIVQGEGASRRPPR